MMLSDVDILDAVYNGRIGVRPEPYNQAYQPASLDIKLGDVEKKSCACAICTEDGEVRWRILPGDFILASTMEEIILPDDIAARVEGKSSLGRLGLAVHITAGFIDPGFHGQVTLELKNLGNEEIMLRKGQYVAQLSFYQLSTRARRPYGSAGLNSHYQNQRGVTHSWL